ncbi:MAG: hypothetical protein J6V68_05195 [Clostridia bacterium]|nr:hypothetical protein [Clostridia bacterium]
MHESFKKRALLALKIATAVCSLVGLVLSLIFYAQDGYSHWWKRLLFFTSQSNLLVGVFFIFFTLYPLIKFKDEEKAKQIICTIKYCLTIAITITGFIFLAVLAPFAHRTGYNAWSLSSILTHIITPVLAASDYFLSDMIPLKKRHLFYSLIPFVFYLIFASVFCILKIDFGRGEAFPYFFLNYYSPAGIFGFSPTTPPFVLGSFYWFIILIGIILSIGLFYMKVHPSNKRKK